MLITDQQKYRCIHDAAERLHFWRSENRLFYRRKQGCPDSVALIGEKTEVFTLRSSRYIAPGAQPLDADEFYLGQGVILVEWNNSNWPPKA